MLRRDLPDGKFDLVSVYGYTGLLCHDNRSMPEVLDQLKPALADIGCVSCFSRMHPIIHEDIPDHDCLVAAGKTISIACLPEDERMLGYRKTTRYEIRKLAKLDSEARFDTSDESFGAFVEIYYATMRDLDAADSYFFDRDWLRNVLNIPGVQTTIGTVIYEGQIVSAALFTCIQGTAQYFLGGANREFSKLAPQKLLLHRAVDWAIEHGAESLHLGGGRGSREDGLFRFKSGFSKTVHEFKLMKLICDETVYADLTRTHADRLQVSLDTIAESNFFPAYRAVINSDE